MKKISLVLVVFTLIFSLTACASKEEKQKLYILNWGEYINEDLVDLFEQEYNVDVVYEEVGSNEAMYEKIKSGNTTYDIAVPSDYMISKLRQESLLVKIDQSLLTSLDDITMNADALSMLGQDGDYAVPYFWGTVGIMYNLEHKSLVEENGYGVLFDSTVIPEGFKVGMYDSARDSVGAALLYLGYDINSNDDSELADAQATLEAFEYTLWGEDNLKIAVIEGNLDVALVYSGDYFDELYVAIDEEYDFEFGYYAPESTNVWVDGLVIPTTSQNQELAHAFINFMIDEENSLENAGYVGYAPVIDEVFAEILADEYYERIVSNNGYRPNFDDSNFDGQAYKYIGKDHDQKLEDVLNKAKAN
jgi:spermidine/putrescine-binding protein